MYFRNHHNGIGDKPDTKNDDIKDKRDPSMEMSTEWEVKVTNSGYNYLISIPEKETQWYPFIFFIVLNFYEKRKYTYTCKDSKIYSKRRYFTK
jgi:hypothetical protein